MGPVPITWPSEEDRERERRRFVRQLCVDHIDARLRDDPAELARVIATGELLNRGALLALVTGWLAMVGVVLEDAPPETWPAPGGRHLGDSPEGLAPLLLELAKATQDHDPAQLVEAWEAADREGQRDALSAAWGLAVRVIRRAIAGGMEWPP